MFKANKTTNIPPVGYRINFVSAAFHGKVVPALLALCSVLLLSGCSDPARAAAEPNRTSADTTQPSIRAVFDADCEDALIAELKSARNEILIAIYNVTRRNITRTLAAAAKRGVKIRVKYDAGSMTDSEGMSSAVTFLESRNIECKGIRMSVKDGRMHNKFAVIDRRVVVTGSFNYTSTASTVNYENIVIIESPELAAGFADQFERIRSK